MNPELEARLDEVIKRLWERGDFFMGASKGKSPAPKLVFIARSTDKKERENIMADWKELGELLKEM